MNNKILLPQLISQLSQSSRLPKKQAESFIKALFSTISESVSLHENVKVKGFGTFKVTRVEARKSVNVSTGATLEIPAHFKLSFTPAKDMAERVNRDFSWLEIVEISENVSNDELNSIDKPETENNPEVKEKSALIQNSKNSNEFELDHMQEITQEPEIAEVPIPPQDSEIQDAPLTQKDSRQSTNPLPHMSVEVDSLKDSQEFDRESEELGEKIEEDFGNIEPVEPFGPIEPDNPEPGQSIPEEKFVTKEELIQLLSSQSTGHYATKEEIADAKKAMKGIYREISEADSRNRSSFRKAVIISIIAASILLCGGLFLVYYLLLHKIDEKNNLIVEKIEVAETPLNKNETSDALVNEILIEQKSEVSNATEESVPLVKTETSQDTKADKKEDNQPEPETPVDTKPSDKKTYDTVTKTRYLTTISRQHYGNYHFWPYIYKENEKILGHPDRIKPGTKVVVPNLSKYGVNPNKAADIAKAKKMGAEIYARYK